MIVVGGSRTGEPPEGSEPCKPTRRQWNFSHVTNKTVENLLSFTYFSACFFSGTCEEQVLVLLVANWPHRHGNPFEDVFPILKLEDFPLQCYFISFIVCFGFWWFALFFGRYLTRNLRFCESEAFHSRYTPKN